jgi:hypothetical protein
MLSPLTEATLFLTASTVAADAFAPKPVEVTDTTSSSPARARKHPDRQYIKTVARTINRKFLSIVQAFFVVVFVHCPTAITCITIMTDFSGSRFVNDWREQSFSFFYLFSRRPRTVNVGHR